MLFVLIGCEVKELIEEAIQDLVGATPKGGDFNFGKSTRKSGTFFLLKFASRILF